MGDPVVYFNGAHAIVEIAPDTSSSWKIDSTNTATTTVAGEYQAEAAMGAAPKSDPTAYVTNIDWFALDWSIVP
jgi:hypothetical protein